jgi:cytoplasmic iron level regulating protein YaaA (DUF328/UPF0246 family)
MDEHGLSASNPTVPVHLALALPVIQALQCLDIGGLQKLMSVSERIAKDTQRQFQEITTSSQVKKSAIHMYKGEVYNGVNAATFTPETLAYAQKHLRILSGLYGILRPLDQIGPYRLEMATRIAIAGERNLYHYWKDAVTDTLQEDLNASGTNVLYNLASDEYYKVLDQKKLKARIVDFAFFDMRQGKPVFVSFNAKKARGLMASYIIRNQVSEPEAVTAFNEEGYRYRPELSKDDEMVFVK